MKTDQPFTPTIMDHIELETTDEGIPCMDYRFVPPPQVLPKDPLDTGFTDVLEPCGHVEEASVPMIRMMVRQAS